MIFYTENSLPGIFLRSPGHRRGRHRRRRGCPSVRESTTEAELPQIFDQKSTSARASRPIPLVLEDSSVSQSFSRSRPPVHARRPRVWSVVTERDESARPSKNIFTAATYLHNITYNIPVYPGRSGAAMRFARRSSSFACPQSPRSYPRFHHAA